MGKTVEQNTNDSLIQRTNACFQCGKIGFFELDHRTALSVAREYRRMGQRGWWKAWTLSNLRWLCHSCHAIKTGHDRKLLARLRIESDATHVCRRCNQVMCSELRTARNICCWEMAA